MCNDRECGGGCKPMCSSRVIEEGTACTCKPADPCYFHSEHRASRMGVRFSPGEEATVEFRDPARVCQLAGVPAPVVPAAETAQCANDRQPGGDHYIKRKLQPWDVIAEWGLDFFQGNILKYVVRWKDKGGVEDLEKAMHYLQKYLEVQRQQERAVPSVPEQQHVLRVTLPITGIGCVNVGEITLDKKRAQELAGVGSEAALPIAQVDGETERALWERRLLDPELDRVVSTKSQLPGAKLIGERESLSELGPASVEGGPPTADLDAERIARAVRDSEEESAESIARRIAEDVEDYTAKFDPALLSGSVPF